MSILAEGEIPQVVTAAASGDEAAFARIVAAHDGDMARVAYLVCGDVDLAHEAVQAAWSIAWRRIGSLRDHDRLRAWLVTIAANETRQLLRRRRRRSIVEISADSLEDGGAVFSTGTHAPDGQLDLLAALARLPIEDRAIVAMRYALGMTSAEIAGATGRSAPGVRSRLARALERLRKDLGDD
jgi:RNA polymerase sigma factor (sigma-70 family)